MLILSVQCWLMVLTLYHTLNLIFISISQTSALSKATPLALKTATEMWFPHSSSGKFQEEKVCAHAQATVISSTYHPQRHKGKSGSSQTELNSITQQNITKTRQNNIT